MVQVQKINPVVRAILVVGAAAGLVVGVTFAALNSQATLTGNTISATAGLQVSTNGVDFGGSIPGFAFNNVVLGDSTGVNNTFKLRNASTTNMNVTLKIPTAPTFTGGTVDPAKVHVKLDCTDPGLTMASTTLTTLTGSEVSLTGGPLTAGSTASCTMNVTLDNDAITGGTTATSSAFDLRFTGTGVSS
jgi:predicted ribosomally synthesized peptide with SipW-like signal peptide